jgi:hypothetical protein
MLRSFACSPLALLAVAMLLLLSCAGPANRGLPSAPGEYPLQGQSVAFDGKNYSFAWQAPDGALQRAQGHDFKLVQDERSFLKVGEASPVLHLKPDEPIAVQGRDSQGSFASWWLPFFVGTMIGGGVPYSTPSYRYPPTDRFGRGDTLQGNEAMARPAPPDYSKVRPAPNAVSGQNAGTGDGTAASNRSAAPVAGQSGGAGAGSAATDRRDTAISGQSGGSGAGSAATDKVSPAQAGQAGSTGDGSAASDRGRTDRGAAVGAPPAAPGNGSGASSRSSGGSAGGARSSGGARAGGRR